MKGILDSDPLALISFIFFSNFYWDMWYGPKVEESSSPYTSKPVTNWDKIPYLQLRIYMKETNMNILTDIGFKIINRSTFGSLKDFEVGDLKSQIFFILPVTGPYT